MEAIYTFLFFSSYRIGHVLFDLVVPFILMVLLYDGLFRYLSKHVLYRDIFVFKPKQVVLNMVARIVLLYTFVFMVYGIYWLVMQLQAYWVHIVVVFVLLVIMVSIPMMKRYTPKKTRYKQKPSSIMDQAENLRNFRKR